MCWPGHSGGAVISGAPGSAITDAAVVVVHHNCDCSIRACRQAASPMAMDQFILQHTPEALNGTASSPPFAFRLMAK